MKTKSAIHGARAAAGHGEAAKTAANRCSTPCPKRHSAHAPERCVQLNFSKFIIGGAKCRNKG